jgi:hypothetical protein
MAITPKTLISTALKAGSKAVGAGAGALSKVRGGADDAPAPSPAPPVPQPTASSAPDGDGDGEALREGVRLDDEAEAHLRAQATRGRTEGRHRTRRLGGNGDG